MHRAGIGHAKNDTKRSQLSEDPIIVFGRFGDRNDGGACAQMSHLAKWARIRGPVAAATGGQRRTNCVVVS
jgi:hypothetical protein